MECIHREVLRAEDSKAPCLPRSVSSLSCYLSSYPICSILSITFHRLSYKLSINHHHHIISCHIHLVEGLSSEKIKALKSNGITTGELATLLYATLCYSMLLYADVLYADILTDHEMSTTLMWWDHVTMPLMIYFASTSILVCSVAWQSYGMLLYSIYSMLCYTFLCYSNLLYAILSNSPWRSAITKDVCCSTTLTYSTLYYATLSYVQLTDWDISVASS